MKNKYLVNISIAIIITLISVIYQRATGPTYPKKFTYENQEKTFNVKLLRSHGGEGDAPVIIPDLGEGVLATITYKRFPTDDPWTETSFQKEGGNLVAYLPHQPPAGKHEYFVTVKKDDKSVTFGSAAEPIFIRFKGEVPDFILIPHIIFMFLAMLLSSLTALEAIANTASYKRLIFVTTGCLLAGGMVLGPIVQKYAFGEYWAGFPYGFDLTDNKVLISVIFWVGASLFALKNRGRSIAVIAAIVLIAIYTIPHSTMGSQFNYNKGQVEIAK
jgi:hypothetical protein